MNSVDTKIRFSTFICSVSIWPRLDPWVSYPPVYITKPINFLPKTQQVGHSRSRDVAFSIQTKGNSELPEIGCVLPLLSALGQIKSNITAHFCRILQPHEKQFEREILEFCICVCWCRVAGLCFMSAEFLASHKGYWNFGCVHDLSLVMSRSWYFTKVQE